MSRSRWRQGLHSRYTWHMKVNFVWIWLNVYFLLHKISWCNNIFYKLRIIDCLCWYFNVGNTTTWTSFLVQTHNYCLNLFINHKRCSWILSVYNFFQASGKTGSLRLATSEATYFWIRCSSVCTDETYISCIAGLLPTFFIQINFKTATMYIHLWLFKLFFLIFLKYRSIWSWENTLISASMNLLT